jgi:hypothetical protein
VDFMVGHADNVTVGDVAKALGSAGISRAQELADPATLARFDRALAAAGVRGQQIRSQAINGDTPDATPVGAPTILQLFGQRFLIDSFVLSEVVFDSIQYRGEKVRRMMPSGLDAMAALGSNVAVRALRDALDKSHYASNLLAARRVVESRPPEAWRSSAYDQWLAALRTLVGPAAESEGMPQAMRRDAWRRKELRAALGSWTELRHDTVLYGKQSYTSSTSCEYPEGFVEPYPRFYATLADLTATLAKRISSGVVSSGDAGQSRYVKQIRDGQSAFFARFADVMLKLQGLAEKELAKRPFSADERAFLKKTIDVRGGGSGPPRYDGWYPTLFYGGAPQQYAPVVSDVHTDPSGGAALEEATGNVEFVVVAVDNGADRAAYVGPAYSYYEFTSKARQRLTDEEWTERLEQGDVPPKPGFTAPFQGSSLERDLAAAPRRSPVFDVRK